MTYPHLVDLSCDFFITFESLIGKYILRYDVIGSTNMAFELSFMFNRYVQFCFGVGLSVNG